MSSDQWGGIAWWPLNPFGALTDSEDPLLVILLNENLVYRFDQLFLTVAGASSGANTIGNLIWSPGGSFDEEDAVLLFSIGLALNILPVNGQDVVQTVGIERSVYMTGLSGLYVSCTAGGGGDGGTVAASAIGMYMAPGFPSAGPATGILPFEAE